MPCISFCRAFTASTAPGFWRILCEGADLLREDASLMFVDTIERHGSGIPANDLVETTADFAAESVGAFNDETKALIAARVTQLRASVATAAPVMQEIVGSAASVARLFPSAQAIQIYYLGRIC